MMNTATVNMVDTIKYSNVVLNKSCTVILERITEIPPDVNLKRPSCALTEGESDGLKVNMMKKVFECQNDTPNLNPDATTLLPPWRVYISVFEIS